MDDGVDGPDARFAELFDFIAPLSKLLSEIEKKDTDENKVKKDVEAFSARLASARAALDALDPGDFIHSEQAERAIALVAAIEHQDTLIAQHHRMLAALIQQDASAQATDELEPDNGGAAAMEL